MPFGGSKAGFKSRSRLRFAENEKTLRLSKNMLAGAGLGAIVGVAATVISLFRIDTSADGHR